MNFGMKNSIILFLFLIPAFLFAQYPTTGNKSRLGWQTTGDGLIWRGAAGDTVNKPNNRNYPYFQLDTVNSVLYRYIQTRGQWQPTSIDVDSLIYATRFWVNSNFFPLQGGTLTGTGGNGFVGFPLQSSPPSTPTTGFSLYAGSTGNNISWMQPDGFFRRLVSPMTGTPRQYQFMARSYTLADSADVAGKLSISDTTSMLLNYPSTVGYGILKSTKTIRADTTSPNGLATRLFAKTLPTSILSGQVAYSNGSNLIGSSNLTYNTNLSLLGNSANNLTYSISNSNSGTGATSGFLATGNTGAISLFGLSSTGYTGNAAIGNSSGFIFSNGSGGLAFLSQNGTIRFTTGGLFAERMRIESSGNLLLGTTTDVATSILTARSTTKSSSPFPFHTTAESNAITGVNGNFEYITDGIGPALSWYNGTRKAYGLESTAARFTSGSLIFTDANQQAAQNNSNLFWDNTIIRLGIGTNTPDDQINAESSTNAQTGLRLTNLSTGSGARSGIKFYATTTSGSGAEDYKSLIQQFGMGHSGTVDGINLSGMFLISNNATSSAESKMAFWAQGTRKMYFIGNNLNVFEIGGEGRGRFVQPLDVITSQSSIDRSLNVKQFGNNSAGALINFQKARGTEASPAAVSTADYSGNFQSRSYDGSAFQSPASFGFQVNGTVASGSVPTDFFIGTGTAQVGAIGGIERFRIYSDGETKFFSTGAVQLNNGTTGQRPTNLAGKLRYNTDTSALEFGTGLLWRIIASREWARGLFAPMSSLTTNRLPKWNGSSLVNSSWEDDGTKILALNNVPVQAKDIETNSGIIEMSAGFGAPAIRSRSSSPTTSDNNGLQIIAEDAGSIIFTVGRRNNTGWVEGFRIDSTGLKYKQNIPAIPGRASVLAYSTYYAGTSLDTLITGTYQFTQDRTFQILGDGTGIFPKIVGRGYGLGNKEASDLSKTESAYAAWLMTDGTIGEKPLSTIQDGNGLYTGSGTLANHTTRARVPDDGNLFFSQTYNTTDSAYIQFVNNLDGNREVRGGLTDTASTGFSKFRFYQDEPNEEMGWEILTSDGTGTTAVGAQGGNLSLYADVAGTVEVRGQELRLNNGEVSMNQYGQGNMKASDLSATDSKFVAKFGDAGKVLDYYLARDTFIEDVTLFSVGTLMNDCQELTVVSSMTSTAPSHQEIRFPDAGDHLRGKKIIVYQKKKEAGIYVPQIKVVGGVSRLYFTTTPGIGGTDPSDQSTLSIDDSTWSSHGTTFEFTCLRIDNTPSYRWVLNQK